MCIDQKELRLDFVSVRGDEYISGKDLITELYGVAKQYGSVKVMCAQSNRMRADTGSDSEVLNILDAAIALQLYTQLTKKNADKEIIDAIKKVLLDNIKAIS